MCWLAELHQERDIPKRWREGEAAGVWRGRPREERWRYKRAGSRDRRIGEKGAGRKKEKKVWREGGVEGDDGGRGPMCKREQRVETWEERTKGEGKGKRSPWWLWQKKRSSGWKADASSSSRLIWNQTGLLTTKQRHRQKKKSSETFNYTRRCCLGIRDLQKYWSEMNETSEVKKN